jgi:hypothetical protein
MLGDTSQPSVSRAITAVTNALAQLAPNYIKMPRTDDELREVIENYMHFGRLYNNTCSSLHFNILNMGVIDCSQICLKKEHIQYLEY